MAIRPGFPELMVILSIVILLFGVGRISKISSELGKGIRSFKEGLQPQTVETKDEVEKQR